MEAALELEDDIFFKDLSKQISLLIMDDDEDDDPIAYYPSVNLQAFTQSMNPARQEAPFLDYHHRQPSKNESKGTGVFIPRSSQPRRQNTKQGTRFITTSGNKSQRPIDHYPRGLPSISNHSNSVNKHPSSHVHHHYSVNHRSF